MYLTNIIQIMPVYINQLSILINHKADVKDSNILLFKLALKLDRKLFLELTLQLFI